MVERLATVLTGLVDSAAAFLPNLVAAIILLVIGLVVGKIVGRVVKELLVRVKLDYYVMETHKPPVSLSDLLATVTRWWIYISFIAAALSMDILGIPIAAAWVSQLVAFIPSIVGAALVVVVAYLIGEYILGLFKAPGRGYGAIAGKLLFFFIMYVAVALALPMLGIDATLVNWVMLAIIVSTGLAFALAVGLGARPVVGAILQKWARKQRYV
ncbi:MAG: hypothetical protein QW548_01530 [Candidatus Aenigmatarchaeota archaeon]